MSDTAGCARNDFVGELSHEDMRKCIHAMPPELADLFRVSAANGSAPICVAGGFVRCAISKQPINDIDIFCDTKERAALLAKMLAEKDPSKLRTKLSVNAVTVHGLTFPVQFICSTSVQQPWRSIESFDFTINAAAIFYDGYWKSYAHVDFYPHLASKQLSPVTINQCCGKLLWRALKFTSQGFDISRSDYAKLISNFHYQLEFERTQLALENTEEEFEKLAASKLLRDYDFVSTPHNGLLPISRSPDDYENAPFREDNNFQ